jgi:outer membrane protein
MRQRISIPILTLAIALGPGVLKAQGQATTPLKVGVINIQEAIGTTAEGKKALADIQKKYAPKKADLDRQQEEIQSLQGQLQKQLTTLSDEEQRRMSRELEEKQKIFKRASEDANADFGTDRDEAIRRIGQKMVRIINDYAQQNGFALVLDDAQIPVYYASREIDLTAEIVKRYDAAYPVDTGATPGADASTAPPKAPSPKTASAAKSADKPKP